METLLDSDLAQAGGWTTVGSSLFLTIGEWFSDMAINEFLQGALLLGSLVFLWFKIKNSILDAKLKTKKLLEKKETK